MSDQIIKTEDDPWLIKFFKDFEKMPTTSKADTNWSVTVDFQVFSEFFIKDIQDIQDRLQNANTAKLFHSGSGKHWFGHTYHKSIWVTTDKVRLNPTTF